MCAGISACGIDVPTTLRLAMRAYAPDHKGLDLRRPASRANANLACPGFLGSELRAVVGLRGKAVYERGALVQWYARANASDPYEERNQAL